MPLQIILLKFGFQNIPSLVLYEIIRYPLFNTFDKLIDVVNNVNLVTIVVVEGARVNRNRFVTLLSLMQRRLKLTMVN